MLPSDKEFKRAFWLFLIFFSFLLIFIGILYVRIPKDDNHSGEYPVSGSLIYRMDSSPENGSAVFELSLGMPHNPPLSDVTVRILDNNKNPINGSLNWTHIDPSSNYLQDGDKLTVEIRNLNIRGFRVVISIRGYFGTIGGEVPETRLGGE